MLSTVLTTQSHFAFALYCMYVCRTKVVPDCAESLNNVSISGKILLFMPQSPKIGGSRWEHASGSKNWGSR